MIATISLVICVVCLGYLVFAMLLANPAAGHYRRAMEFVAKKNLFEAEKLFLRAIEADGLHTQSLLKLAEIYEAQGMLDKCLPYLRRVLMSLKNPFDKLAMHTETRIADLYYNAQKYQEAWQIYLLLLKMGAYTADLFFKLGELYMIQKRYGEAVFFFDESLALDDKQPKTIFFKAVSLLSMKEKKEAIVSLKLLEEDEDYGTQALYLLGKIHHDMQMYDEASAYFGVLLRAKKPIYLKDILLYKGYHILDKENPTDDEFNRAVQYFNRGSHLKNIFSDLRKEFLYHLGGVYLMKGQFNEAKLVFKDLCKIDAFYKAADLIYKGCSKEMLIKEEQKLIVEHYLKYRYEGRYKHEIGKALRLDEFFPTHLPVLVMEKLDENAQKKFFEKIKKQEGISAKMNVNAPKTPMDLSVSKFDVFLKISAKMAERLGVVVDKNLGDSQNEAIFFGIDRNDLKCLLFFSKPSSLVGAISVMNVLDRKERMDANKAYFLTCGTFTEEAKEKAKEHQIYLYDKHELKKML